MCIFAISSKRSCTGPIISDFLPTDSQSLTTNTYDCLFRTTKCQSFIMILKLKLPRPLLTSEFVCY